MKILFGVQTEGNGHITQAIGVKQHLKNKGHDVALAFAAKKKKGLAQLSGIKWFEPSRIVELQDNQIFDLVGLQFKAIHAPGHTKGSLMFEVNGEVLISGDVLFAGSIGRTDLPGGSWSAMQKSLREKVLPLPDVMQVLPGHGPETSIGRERKYNQFLQDLKK